MQYWVRFEINCELYCELYCKRFEWLELYWNCIGQKNRLLIFNWNCIAKIIITDYCIGLKKPVLVNPGIAEFLSLHQCSFLFRSLSSDFIHISSYKNWSLFKLRLNFEFSFHNGKARFNLHKFNCSCNFRRLSLTLNLN